MVTRRAGREEALVVAPTNMYMWCNSTGLTGLAMVLENFALLLKLPQDY